MKWTILVLYLLVLAAGYALQLLNLRHLKRHGDRVPPGFEGAVDRQDLARISAYTVALNRVGLAESVVDSLLLLLFVFGGWLPLYDQWIASLSGSFVLSGILFAFGLQLAKGVVAIPFSLYRNFVVENRYGFNTMTIGLWLADLGRGLLVSSILLGLLLGAGFWVVQASPDLWWFWGWGCFAAFTLLVMYLSPYLIEPLFFKFEPIRQRSLEESIRDLMQRAGLQVSRVFQVDASRRSRHSNAYFTGIGRVKRIVLFDTLIEQMGASEILAILAHEVGHWKKRHIFKRLVRVECAALAGLYLAYGLIEWGGLPGLFGLAPVSFAAQFVLLSVAATIVLFPLTPLSSWSSRRHERQADDFACTLSGDPAALASALVKLCRENLANLHPHPLYAAFYYSHPPVVDRVQLLKRRAQVAENKSA